jgi:hypothetical protein
MDNGFTNINEGCTMESQPKDTGDMTTELNYMTLDDAQGTIEAGDAQQEQLEAVTQRLSTGEFHTTITGNVPKVCIDGRPGGELGANSAGGTFTLTVADDLTTQRFSAGKSLAEADREVAQVIIGEGEAVGGHCDEKAGGEKCGCGAKDRIKDIYRYLADNQQAIREQAKKLGVDVSDDVHELIIGRALERGDFSSGAELSATLKEVAGTASESVLRGAHKEVVAVVNTRPDTSLDREALTEAFGEEYQAFNIDAWSFTEAAKAISLTEEEAAQKVVAMVYYNLATAGVLCGPQMRVVTVA